MDICRVDEVCSAHIDRDARFFWIRLPTEYGKQDWPWVSLTYLALGTGRIDSCVSYLGCEVKAIFMAHQNLLRWRIYSQIRYISACLARSNRHNCFVDPKLVLGLEF